MEQARKRLEEARKSKEDDDDDDEGMDRLVAQAYQELHEEEEAKKYVYQSLQFVVCMVLMYLLLGGACQLRLTV